MRPAEYAELRADIAAHGIEVALDVVEGVVLDGRHRLRVARQLALETVPVREVVLGSETARA